MPRNATTDARRSDILAAALDCFTRRGYAATAIDDVRRTAGASVGSIYHHFKSKEQLAAALFVEGLRDYQQSLLAELARRTARRSARQGVTLVVDHYLRWVAGHPDWARYLLEMGQAQFIDEARDEIDLLNEHFFGELQAWFEPHRARGELVRLPMTLYLPILVGPSREFARAWLRGGGDMAQARRVLAEAAWKALRSTRTIKEKPSWSTSPSHPSKKRGKQRLARR